MQAFTQRVDAVLEAAVSGQRIVGAVAMVAQRGEVVYQRAIGAADREAGRAMTLATPFRVASLTKGYSMSVPRDPAAAGSTLARGAVRWGGAYGPWWIDPARETSAVLLTNTAFEGMTGPTRDAFQQAVHA